jgi:hypothetical protein
MQGATARARSREARRTARGWKVPRLRRKRRKNEDAHERQTHASACHAVQSPPSLLRGARAPRVMHAPWVARTWSHQNVTATLRAIDYDLWDSSDVPHTGAILSGAGFHGSGVGDMKLRQVRYAGRGAEAARLGRFSAHTARHSGGSQSGESAGKTAGYHGVTPPPPNLLHSITGRFSPRLVPNANFSAPPDPAPPDPPLRPAVEHWIGSTLEATRGRLAADLPLPAHLRDALDAIGAGATAKEAAFARGLKVSTVERLRSLADTHQRLARIAAQRLATRAEAAR